MGFLMMMMKKEEYMMVAPLQIQMQAVRAPIRHFRHVRQSLPTQKPNGLFKVPCQMLVFNKSSVYLNF